jgi:signal recognition particle GTPase
VQQVNSLIKQYTEMRRMMQQLSSSGMFGGAGGRMMGRMAGVPGMDGSGDPVMAGLPAGPSRRKKKKKKKRR